MGALAAKLHAIATMISLPEMQFNIFMIWSLQSIHTELAKLYSRKLISCVACPRMPLQPVHSRNNWSPAGTTAIGQNCLGPPFLCAIVSFFLYLNGFRR